MESTRFREPQATTRGVRGPTEDRPTLLLVDDLPENLFALEQILRRDDVEILQAASGREALEHLLTHQVALAIIDVQMPEMDGLELASWIRGVERTRHLPIIFVTAGSRDQQRMFRGYEAGAVDFLYKPIDVQIFRSKVDVFITLERQRREIEASENRFRALVQATSQAIWRLSPKGLGLDGSERWLEFTGQSEAAWREGRWLEAVHPDDRERVRRAWEEARASWTLFEHEYRALRPGGGSTWTLARAAPVFDRRGRLLEWLGTNIDIEDRKRAQLEQRRSEKMRELFVGILGHDLRNPLSSITAGTQLALRRTDDPAIRDPLRRVLHGGDRMLRMIDELLDMTRIRFGGAVLLRPGEVDLAALVDDVLLGAPASLDAFEVSTKGDTKGWWDQDRLFQVLSNLVGNACEYGKGEGPIEITLDGTREEEVVLRVKNHGPPIPADLQRILFEPFQGTNHATRSTNGLGLGLFITRNFVAAHGGRIEIEASDEERTIFQVTLPRGPCGPSGGQPSEAISRALR